jgi:hypothetical protein
VDVALKAVEEAVAKMEAFVADLRQSAKELQWMRDDFMERFLGQHAVVRDYCSALLRKALLERVLAATIRKIIGALAVD